MRLTTYEIAVSLILSALSFLTACRDSSSGIKDNRGNPDIMKESAVKSTPDTRPSENQAEPQYESPDETINIGLIVSLQISKSELALAASHGAELAINQANKAGGYDHRYFRLLVRSCDGPWGIAAKEAVSLITDMNVIALLTSLDGRNAHLIEQVATKAKVVMLSARATDPTLSQAFVPWYFRCVPDDNLQAEALADELVNRRKLNNLIVVSVNSYNGKLASGSFMKKLKIMEVQMPKQIFYDQLKPDFNNLIKQIKKTGIQHIVLFGGPENSLGFYKKIDETGEKFNVYGTFAAMGENNTLREFWKYTENMVFTSSGFWFTHKGKEFQEVFQETYGYLPGPAAAYAYDGMNLLLEAIRKGGPEHEEIVHSLAEINYEGVTGTIQFDDKGNRIGKPGLIEIKHGIPLAVRRTN